ncbi:MAG: HAMP domain-containing histidine kinase [Rhodospirillaceae bacterium]|nr:HAMP domain-containing histidine kinase [Rhodospirillaceae bacterium]
MKNSLSKQVLAIGNVKSTAIISLVVVGVSVAVTLTDVWLLSHQLFPALYLSILIPSLVAPPVIYILVRLARELSEAEQRAINELEKRKQAIIELRQSEERQRRFSADIAHELRTPLSILKLHLDDMEETKVVKELRQDVDDMSRLVEQLLTIARLDMLGLETNHELDLLLVCKRVVSRLAPMAIKEKRSIEIETCGSPLTMMGNSDAIEQAIRNLVENALKYSKVDSTITVKVGDGATFSVIDHGSGIPPKLRDKVFDRFIRSDQLGIGSGLGLSIVKRIVDGHGGEICIRDTAGGGTTITATFEATEQISKTSEN